MVMIRGLQYDDFTRAMENLPARYFLSAFTIEHDHHWKDDYKLAGSFDDYRN